METSLEIAGVGQIHYIIIRITEDVKCDTAQNGFWIEC